MTDWLDVVKLGEGDSARILERLREKGHDPATICQLCQRRHDEHGPKEADKPCPGRRHDFYDPFTPQEWAFIYKHTLPF